MLSVNYHIGHNFYKKDLDFKIFLLEIFSHLQKVLSITKFQTAIVNSLNKELTEIYIETEGIKSAVKGFSKERAVLEYRSAENFLVKARVLYTKLEKIKFFNCSETEMLAEQIVSNLYSIETIVRKISFSADENSIQLDDDKLNEFAAFLSANTLQHTT